MTSELGEKKDNYEMKSGCDLEMEEDMGFQHETETIVLKRAEVDKKIVPMVRFFNSFSGIITLFSCEGSPDKNSPYKPYISFICRNHNSFFKLVDQLSLYCEDCFIPMEANVFEGTLTYVFRFENQEELLSATERMLEENEICGCV